ISHRSISLSPNVEHKLGSYCADLGETPVDLAGNLQRLRRSCYHIRHRHLQILTPSPNSEAAVVAQRRVLATNSLNPNVNVAVSNPTEAERAIYPPDNLFENALMQ
ncbi:hypothetical protein KI387_009083, partial [Taxus chinensis]